MIQATNPPKKVNGEIKAKGIKNISPKTAIKKHIGIETIWNIDNGNNIIVAMPSPNDAITKIFKIAIGIEKNKQNHEYQGRIPKNKDPPA